MMNIKKLIAVVAVVFASFIQVGCGNQTPTTMGYNQGGAQYPTNGMGCPAGSTMYNGQCISTPGSNNNNTGVNNGQGCQAGYFYIQAPGALGCYQQGICYQGYAYVTPLGMCYLHN